MGTVTGQIMLDARKEDVWTFITAPKNFPRYVSGYAHGKTLSTNQTGVGAAYEWYGKLGPFRLKSTEEIVAWEVLRRVAYKGSMFAVPFRSSMMLHPEKNNKTRLTVSIQYTVPLFLGGSFLDRFLVRKIVEHSVRESLRKLGRIFKKI